MNGPQTRDGRQKHPLYQTWRGMLKRCEKPSATGYQHYGGRGIRVCERWHNFWKFVEDVGAKPGPEHQLDRTNNNGHYEPGNVQWSTSREQHKNTRRNTRLTVNGVTKIAADWAAEHGMPRSTFHNRLLRGWTPEQAVRTPIAQKAEAGSVVAHWVMTLGRQNGLNINTLHSRIRRGWSIGDAVNTPAAPQRGGNYGKQK